MRVVSTRARQVLLATAVTVTATLALPAAALADAPRLAACDDLLVTISPSGTSGEVRAAAVTAQVLVADQPGWGSVTWTVPTTTDLREVLVLHADGTTRSVGDQRSGTASNVLQLGFCGSLAGTTDQGDDAEVVGGDAAEVRIEPEAAAPQLDPDPSRSEGDATAMGPTDAGPSDGHHDAADRDLDGTGADGAGAAGKAADEPAETDDTGDDDDAAAAASGGPTGPTAAPQHDASARLAEVLATPVAGDDAVPSVTLTAAASSDRTGTGSLRGPAGRTDGSVGLATVALLSGAAAGVVLLLVRRRFAVEVPA